MYRLLRNTHLLLGLFSCAYALMYGVSSVQMAHNRWFNLRPAVTESRISLPVDVLANARMAALELMNRHGLRGDLRQLTQRDGGYAFRIIRPGTVHEVQHKQSEPDVLVRTSVAGFLGMLNRIHHTGGLWHDYWLINFWGVFVAVVSVALVLLAGTGIYLWFKIHSERRIGLALLTLNLGYSLTLIVLMRIAS